MKPEYEIHKTLMISTAHVRGLDAQRLEDGEHGGVAYTLDEYGFLLWVEKDGEGTSFPPLSDALRNCIKIAREQGCQYLRLDRDGPVYDGLETFDW